MKYRQLALTAAGIAFLFGLMPRTAHTLYSSEHRTSVQPEERRVNISPDYGKLPLSFEPNRGQFDAQFTFGTQGLNYGLFLNTAGATLKLRDAKEKRSATLDLRLAGANPHASSRGENPLPGIANYFYGSSENWITNVPTYDRVVVADAYPGIDVVYYGNQGRFEYDFVVNPGASPQTIGVSFPNASKLALADGALVISLGNQDIAQKKPEIYQLSNGEKSYISGEYVLLDRHRVGFRIGAYDTRKPVVIDPQLIYAIFGQGGALPQAAAIDSTGAVYIAGRSPDSIASDQTDDVYVAKINANGTAFLWANQFGAKNTGDQAWGIAVDSQGNAYVTGDTAGYSRYGSFPTKNPIQAPPTAVGGAFVTKFDTNGNMLYSTVLGSTSGAATGAGTSGQGIAVDALGNMYVTGWTGAADFPTWKPFQANLSGAVDVFVSVLNPQGSAFIYSTYIGGSSDDFANAITVDASGNSYVTGATQSSDFPTSNPIQATHAGQPGTKDAFVFKLNPAGSALQYSTYLGGSGDEEASSVAVDASGNAYVAGSTKSTDFPVVNAFQSTLLGPSDAFVAKINSSGSALVYSTYLGGTGGDSTDAESAKSYGEGANAIAVNSNGNAYVAGVTNSTDFPQVRSLQSVKGGGDAFVTKFAPDGTSLVYSTLLGGGQPMSYGNGPNGPGSEAEAIASDSHGNVYVVGTTSSADFPITANPTNFDTTTACCAWPPGYRTIVGFIAKLMDDAPANTWTRVEQNNNAIQYSGDWYTNSSSSESGGSAYLTLAGSATFTFSGTAARWIGFSDPWSGIANVYVDGALKGSIDTYASSTKYQVVQYTITGLASGNHTLKIQATGQHNSAASAAWVWVDAFDFMSGTGSGGDPYFKIDVAPTLSAVTQGGSTTYNVVIGAFNGFNGTVTLGATGFPNGVSGVFNPPTINGSGPSTLTVSATGTANTGSFVINISGTSGSLSDSEAVSLRVNPGGGTITWSRVEQNNAAIQYSGDWYSNSSSNESGGSAYLTLAGSATFSFSGTGARWVGFSDPWSGIANVYVDGALKGSIDTYSSTTKYQVLQYTITGLASGNHTLTIQATGQHNSAASSAWVWVDAFDSTSDGGGGGDPDFSLTVTPSSANVNQGGSTTYTVSVTSANGFSGPVSLSAAGFGYGAGGSFNPSSIQGSGSSTFTVTTTSTAQTGAFTLTITGSGPSMTHSATTTLNVSSTGSAPNWTRVEQNNAAVQYAGQWYSNTSSSESGGSAYLALSGSATLSFSGTAVRWIGFSDPWSGIANVYVDGVLKTSADTYSATTKYQVVQYTITGLAPGNHTIRIEATGQHDSSASSAWIWVDGFDVAN